jgi:hypothetical protein
MQDRSRRTKVLTKRGFAADAKRVQMIPECSRAWFNAGVLAIAAIACGPSGAAPLDPFRAASLQYQAGRYSDAFGRFLSLAVEGDADAARIVLFMHSFGPTLYGSYWDLNPDDVAVFTRLATNGKQRRSPDFQPAPQGAKHDSTPVVGSVGQRYAKVVRGSSR